MKPGRSREADWRDSSGRVGEKQRVIAWPTQAGETAELPGRYPRFKAPSKLHGSWGHRREAGEIRRGRQEGPSQTGEAGEEKTAFAPPTRAQKACWAPR